MQVQRNYRDIDDIIRMCRRRIRVPDQWYGDYLAMVGAARIGERRLKELAAKFGKPLIRDFIREWFDYSERRMIQAMKQASFRPSSPARARTIRFRRCPKACR